MMIFAKDEMTTTVVTETELTSVELGHGYHAVQRIQRPQGGKYKTDYFVTKTKGRFRALQNRPHKSEHVYIATPEEFEDIKQRGFSAIAGNGAVWKRNVITTIANNGRDIGDHVLYRFDPHHHRFYELSGRVIPVGVNFTYIEARMNNRVYDLEKALRVLKQRSDITWVEDGVSYIPYYNREDDTDQCLDFWWTPSQEQYEAMIADNGNMFEVAFEHDMLGLRAGGAAKYKTFYEG